MATSGVPLWSTTAASNASSDPAVNWAEGMAPSAVNDSARGMMASVAKWRDDIYGLTTGGTATAYTVTTNATYATAAAMSGAVFTIIPDNTNGAAPTLAVDGLTARALNISTGVAVPTGLLVAGTPYLVKYVHASTEFIVLGVAGKHLLASLDIISGTSSSTIAVDDTLPIYDLSATANRRMLVSDFLKVVNLLTADATPDSAADYVMTYDASATAAKKVLLQDIPSRLPRGYIDGCILSNGTDATNDINIAAGVCRDSTNAVDITVPTITGKQLDANWVAGSTAGMRDSSAGIANATYHIYAFRTAASATGDIYATTQATVANALTALQSETGGAGYAYGRMIGSIVRTGGAITPFLQSSIDPDYFALKTAVLDHNSQPASTDAVTITVGSLPTGIIVLADIGGAVNAATTGGGLTAMFSSLLATDQTVSTNMYHVTAAAGSNSHAIMRMQVETNTSAQIRGRLSHSGANDEIRVISYGWRHPRGRA